VGPYSVIDGEVSIGAGTRLMHSVSLRGPMRVGAGNVLYPNVCVGYEPQDRKFDPSTDGAGVIIGDRNILREGVTIHRATGAKPTTMGDDNYLMCNSHLGHDVVIGSRVTMANGALMAGHVEVGDGVVFGGNAAVHQFCRIGRMVMFSGLVCVTQDVPPFCVVYHNRSIGSLNIIGLRRAGLREHIHALKQAFRILFMSGLPRPRAIEAIRSEVGDDPLCREVADFAEQSKRGICPYYGERGTHDVELLERPA
jgi:UDP-N-acetylglucosamine acyltransferase